jgi:hypothetical protein
MNRQLGYSSPADIIDKYPTFFWNSVSTHIEDGIKYLNMTVSGRQWIANLHHHILCAEHAHRFMGPQRWIELCATPMSDNISGGRGPRVMAISSARNGVNDATLVSGTDLSPFFHPAMDRVPGWFEPCWLGDATGWGAEPSV